MIIERIKLGGFKSIAQLELRNICPYSVFAGANGAGKSNLFDAFAFIGEVIDAGAAKAISRFGGFQSIQCYKLEGQEQTTFEFELDTVIDGETLHYRLKIHGMDSAIPKLEEELTSGGQRRILRMPGEVPAVFHEDGARFTPVINWKHDRSSLMFLPESPLSIFLLNIRVFRFDPQRAKEPHYAGQESTELNPTGSNIASILAKLEQNDMFRASIMEWLELLVPGLEHIQTEEQQLDGSRLITFKEQGTHTHFPARLISDGTIYALCIMTAILSRNQSIGMTLIEEPERGMHPDAISELIGMMRESASSIHPIFITSHSEAVVRASKKPELWLVDKSAGKTRIKNAAEGSTDLGDLNLDTAWLMNMFGAGLPW